MSTVKTVETQSSLQVLSLMLETGKNDRAYRRKVSVSFTSVARGEEVTNDLGGLQSEFHFMQRKKRLNIFQGNKVASSACVGPINQQSQVLEGQQSQVLGASSHRCWAQMIGRSRDYATQGT